MKKIILSIFLLAPMITNAALVPCGKTADGSMCTLCDLIVGIQNLANYILSVMVVFGLLAITIAGVLYIVSAGTPGLMGMAKAALKNALIGTAICLLAFLTISTVMNILAAKENLGVQRASNWYTFECKGQDAAESKEEEKKCEKKKLDSIEIQCEQGTAIEYITLSTQEGGEKPKTYALKAKAKYSCENSGEATEEDVTASATWTSADETVTKVEAGNVQAIQAGFTTIKVAYADPDSKESKESSASAYVDSCPLTEEGDGTDQQENTSQEGENQTEEQAFLWKDDSNALGIQKAHAMAGIAQSGACAMCKPKKQTSSACVFVAGNKNAKKVFVIGRSDHGKSRNACDKPDNWNPKDASQLKDFKSFVEELAGGLKLVGGDANQFAIYRSDFIYPKNQTSSSYSLEQKCLGVIQPGSLVLSAFVNHSKKESLEKTGGAYSSLTGAPVFYCDVMRDKQFVFAHEQIGHQFAVLFDEYESEENAKKWEGSVISAYNCTKDSNCNKWKDKGGGCYEGCAYMNKGVYRSSEDSVMRNHYKLLGFSFLQGTVIKFRTKYFPQKPEPLAEQIRIKAWTK